MRRPSASRGKDYVRGRTALHWATEHFIYWMSTRLARDWEPDHAHAVSYASLLVKLILIGANIHALDAARDTPFTKLVRAGCNQGDNLESAPFLCARWVEILTASGYSLSDFVEVKNEVQKLVADERRTKGTYLPNSPLGEVRLLSQEDTRLTFELKYYRALHVRGHRHLPGA